MTNLDGITTSIYNTLDVVEFVHSTDGSRLFRFINPDATAALAGMVIVPADNASARWVSLT